MIIESARTTQAVFEHHLQAVRDRDVDAIVFDFADNGLLMTSDGIFRGLEQIRMVFTNIINGLPAEVVTNLQVDHLDIEGEFVYLLWSSGTIIKMATDTLCIRDGKIVMQSMAAVFGS